MCDLVSVCSVAVRVREIRRSVCSVSVSVCLVRVVRVVLKKLTLMFKLITTSALTIALTATSAFSQDSRTDEIARAQAEKAGRLRPNVATGAEKSLAWLEGHFTDPSTVYTTFGGLYPSSGFAPGLAMRHSFGPARLNAGGAYSVRAYKSLYATLGFPELLNEKLDVQTHVRWIDATQVPFYGVGNDTTKDDRVNYGLKGLDSGGSIALKPVRWFRDWRRARRTCRSRIVAAKAAIHPSTPSPVPACRVCSPTPSTAMPMPSPRIDWRESPGYNRRGGLYSLTLHDMNDSDNPLSFRRVDAEVQQFLPILKEHWVLAFRGLVQTTDVDDNDVVPYYRLPTLGGSKRHRGYADFRFQDRHMMLLSGEYRWIPSRVLDMAFFVDAGKVTAERRDLDFNDLKTAYGIGFRIHGPTFTPLRFDIAHGDEGFRFHITGGIAY